MKGGVPWPTVFGAVLLLGGCGQTGVLSQGSRRARLEASPLWRDGRLKNPLAQVDASIGRMVWAWIAEADEDSAPATPVPVTVRTASDFATPPASGLRVTLLGHSSFLLEIDEHRVLVDPVWKERSSPFSWIIGPRCFHAPPLELEALPELDAIVISHDHYDHLDYDFIAYAIQKTAARFIVPLGIGVHLEHWGVPASRIVELEWWRSESIGDLTVTATPARHFSGRSVFLTDMNQTLWVGWAIRGTRQNVFYSGDTSIFPGFDEIGARLGPFDVAMIEIGAYDPRWSDVHLGPEQVVFAGEMVGAKLLIPAHWASRYLALHGWTEPVERLRVSTWSCRPACRWSPRPASGRPMASSRWPARKSK